MRLLASALCAVLGLGLAGPPATAVLSSTPSTPAAAAGERAVAGSGRGADTLFPTMGNGGYDVRHYGVRLRYRPASNHLAATVRIRAVAERALSSFHLDLRGLRVAAIRVDDRPATWRRHGHELVITPRRPVEGRFLTRVTYAGVPRVYVDPDDAKEGLVPTADGATALGQPVGAVAWLPSDNQLGDKATWAFRITAPARLTVAANGLQVSRRRHGNTVTWHWRAPDPMPTELAMFTVGHYDVYRSTYTSVTGRRVPVRSYIDPSYGAAATSRRLLPQVMAFEEHYFGAYPLAAAGMVVDDADVGYALETMTRPFYPEVPDAGLLVHEMAHQWFGDSLTPTDWHDIWLNEGFATYAEWLWSGTHDGRTPAEHFDRLYSQPADADLWSPSPRGFTDPADLFGAQSYDRGAMTLQALRERVGDPAFFRIVRTWAVRHRAGSVTTAQFVALAEQISGQRLDGLVHDWLDVASKPAGY